MRVGINEVILSGQSDGSRQRELNVLRALAAALTEESLDAIFYLASDIDASTAGLLSSLVSVERIKQVKIPSRPTVMRIGQGALRWQGILGRDGCDLFHTSYYPIPRIRQKVTLTVNDLRFLKFPETYPFARRQFLRVAVPRAIRRADLVYAISEFTKTEICEAYDVSPEKVIVAPIPRGESFRPISAVAPLEDVRRRYRLPEKFLLCVGHLEPRKNLKRVVEAFTAARARIGQRFGLVILGKENHDWGDVLATVRTSSVREDILFTGYVPDSDMPLIYNLAEMLVFPSLHEGFGIPVLEAMSTGIPVVTSNSTALREVGGDAAILVDPLSVDAIALGIETVLTDGDCRKAAVEKGLARAAEFEPEKTARAIVSGYKRLG